MDMKSIMGEVLYDSEIAPYMGDWEGVERSRDYGVQRELLCHTAYSAGYHGCVISEEYPSDG